MKNYKWNLLLLSLILSLSHSSYLLAKEKTGRRKPLMDMIPPTAVFDDDNPFQTGATRKRLSRRALLKRDKDQWVDKRHGKDLGWEETDDPFAEHDDFAENPVFDDESSDY
jgi:hypothetical protein